MHKVLATIYAAISATYLALGLSMASAEYSYFWAYLLVSAFDTLVAVTYAIAGIQKSATGTRPPNSQE